MKSQSSSPMESNNKELESAAGSVPTRGSAAKASATQQDNVEGDDSDDEVECEDMADEKRKRKLRSPVWEHFKKEKIGREWKAIYNHCKKQLGGKSKNGTTHLWDHLKICPHKKRKDIKQCFLNPKVSSDGTTKLGTYQFNQEHARSELGKMIVMHEYPLSMVDHVGFRNYSHALQPLFKMVSRNTIKADIMKMFDCQKEKTMKLLDTNGSRIALTSDMWTSSNQKRGSMAITSHFIDDSWTLQSRLVRFLYVSCLHTAEVLANATVDCLLDWNLDYKLSTLTLDNYSSDDAMVDVMLEKIPPTSLMLEGRLFHMRCSAHILNLVVKDGLDLISEAIENARSSVAFWTATLKRDEKFVEAARQLKIPSDKKLELDCKTRWNSTYLMLNTAMVYKDVFPCLKQREPLYKKVPTEEDWLKVRMIASKLEIFYLATELFSGTKYVTINLFFSTMCEFKSSIGQWLNSNEMEVRSMAANMKEKFDKYWDKINLLLAIGSIIDPRYKMKIIQFYYPELYPNEHLEEVEKVKGLLNDMIDEYKKQPKQFDAQHQSLQVSSSSMPPPLPKRGLCNRFENFMDSNTSTEVVKSELDSYLDDPLVPRSSDFDILCWWRANGFKYPTLQNIARDVLAIPVTTVASESTFSTSGRVISAHRSRLHPKTIEALMCTRDWLWSEIEAAEVQSFDNDADIEIKESDLGTIMNSAARSEVL